MQKASFFPILLIASIGMSGCVSGSQLTPLQQRVMQSKELEGTYEDAFKAALNVLQDKEYAISVSDYSGGIIHAKTAHLSRKQVWPVGATEKYEIQISFEKFTEKIVKMRASIHKESFINTGAKPDPNFIIPLAPSLRDGLVQDPKVYQDFYAEIQKEMFRRGQLNK